VSADRRAEVLRQAAQDKRAAATKRAEAGLRALIKNGEPVNFRAVASAAGVSVDFLYRHRELRARIEHLRARQQPTDDNVVATLTARLREARRENADLKAQLAAAHGELLALRRQLPAATSQTTRERDR
jgi:hypothetical protein